jgi:hypothetical protein
MFLTTRNPLVYFYSDYQIELHDITWNLRDKCLSYRRTTQWLNENGYQTPGGVSFSNNHVHSLILKKKRLKDERPNREVEVEYRDSVLSSSSTNSSTRHEKVKSRFIHFHSPILKESVRIVAWKGCVLINKCKTPNRLRWVSHYTVINRGTKKRQETLGLCTGSNTKVTAEKTV